MHSFKRTQPTSFRRSFPLGVSLSKPFFPKQYSLRLCFLEAFFQIEQI